MLENELGVAGHACGEFGRQRDGFIEGIRMQGLGTTEHRGERLIGRAHDIVVRILRRQRYAGGLTMRAKHHGLGFFRPETLHDLRPEKPCSTQLRNLHKEIHADAEEEREPGREVVDSEPARRRGTHVLHAVGERVGQFLHRSGTGLVHVITGDRNRIEF